MLTLALVAAATMSMSDLSEGFIKNTEKTFGAPHPTREKVSSARRIVVKVTSPFAQSMCGCSYKYAMHICPDLHKLYSSRAVHSKCKHVRYRQHYCHSQDITVA